MMKRLFGVFLLAVITTFTHSVMGQLQVSLPDTVIEAGETSALLPISIEGLSGDSISGFTFKVGFDPAVISITNFSKSSTLSSGFQVNGNGDTNESYIVSGAGSNPIYNDGVIIYLEATITGEGSSTLEFLNVEINEGEPPFTANDGNITTGVTAPAAPTLSSPTNGASNVNIDPTLQWNNVSGASSYQVQVSTAQNFGTLFGNYTTKQNSEGIEGLDYSTQYYWRVKAINEVGESNWSSVRSFTTIIEAPEVPVLTSPANDATGLSISPELDWQSSARAASYQVQVSSTSNFNSPFVDVNTSETSEQLSNLDRNTKYYWRVKAINEGGESGWSSVRSFTTIKEAPEVPSLTSPGNGASDLSISPELDWQASARAESYQLQVASTNTFNNPIVDTNTSDTQRQLSNLDHSTQYFWRVRAVNNGGNSAWSSVRSFTTVIEPPSVPTLSNPGDGAENVSINPELSWGDSERAESYEIQVSVADDFSSTIIDDSLSGTSLQLENLEHLTQYYWRVKAENEGGQSDWSQVFSFTTIIDLPAISDLIFPEDEAGEVDTLVTFVWSDAARAATFQVQLSEESDFGSTISNQELADTVLSVGSLAFSTTYFWRVKSKNVAGESEWSTINEFTTGAAEAGTPSLVNPQNNATGIDTSLTFTWNESENAVRYEIQVSENVNFGSVLQQNDQVSDTSITFGGFEFETRYYWRVRAFAENTTSGWSSTFNFTTAEKENEPPVVENPLGSIVLDEDFGSQTITDLNSVFSDPEGGSLTFEILEAFNVAESTIEDESLVLTSKENLFGSGQVIIKATDEEGASVSDTLEVEILSVNDIPFFVEIPDTLRFVNGQEYTFEFGDLILDVEDDLSDLSFSFDIQPDDIEISFSISQVAITIIASNFVGEGLLTFEITDSDGGVLEESIVLVIEAGTSLEGGEDVPNEFQLSQNYPNPFNPTTKIEYQLPKASTVNFIVFDMTGRQVYSEINQQKAAGNHSINFDASGLSSGIYIYRLKAAEFAQTKKMTLIK